jgi:hypothetical protein
MRMRYRILLGAGLAASGFVLVMPGATKAVRFADRATATPAVTEPAPEVTTSAPPAQAVSEKAATTGQARLVARIDPETGELGLPTGESLSPMEEAALSTSDEGLLEVHHPNGAVSIDLQGRFQSLSMVTVGKDGKVQLHCVDTPAGARAALATESHQPVIVEE